MKKELLDKIKLSETYESNVYQTTTYYFNGPKELLKDVEYLTDCENAVECEIAIEIPMDWHNQRFEDIGIMIGSVEELSSGNLMTTDWVDYDRLTEDEIHYLLDKANKELKKKQ